MIIRIITFSMILLLINSGLFVVVEDSVFTVVIYYFKKSVH